MTTLANVQRLTKDGPTFFRILEAGSTVPIANKIGDPATVEEVRDRITSQYRFVRFVNEVQLSIALLSREK